MARRRVESVSGSLIELADWPPQGLSETEADVDGERLSLVLLRDGSAVMRSSIGPASPPHNDAAS